ncbi:hypothetical protein MM326_17825 [Alkalihalobacillus sp. LMS6]|uniref:hypothetical protein n=1 Tax=Bacillaceae TaxID=186817 RepID=UPI000C0896EB|nr:MULTISPECIES: hypothetical protein [Bacillaceae]UTR05912.1 hypothetical protein MM326_17825 [Alkalihalobacillus sp. LMS6]
MYKTILFISSFMTLTFLLASCVEDDIVFEQTYESPLVEGLPDEPPEVSLLVNGEAQSDLQYELLCWGTSCRDDVTHEMSATEAVEDLPSIEMSPGDTITVQNEDQDLLNQFDSDHSISYRHRGNYYAATSLSTTHINIDDLHNTSTPGEYLHQIHLEWLDEHEETVGSIVLYYTIEIIET